MQSAAFFAVILAAAMHACWNAVVKGGTDRLYSIGLISIFAASLCGCAIPFLPWPQPAAWPWIVLSVCLHLGYKLFLIRAYKAGDLGQVYAIARGAAPLLISVVMFLVFGETLRPVAAAGILCLAGGIWLMGALGGRGRIQMERQAVLYALGTSIFIASYTITDGLGARHNGSAHSYAAWMFFLDGCVMLTLLLSLRGRQAVTMLESHWIQGLVGGAMMAGAYWIVIWAMTQTQIGIVSALRESSVLFAAVISVVFLKEPLTRWRIIAALVIMSGVILTRVG